MQPANSGLRLRCVKKTLISSKFVQENVSGTLMNNRYNAEIVAGALVPIGSRILAQLYLQNVSEKELKYLLTVENILQKRSL